MIKVRINNPTGLHARPAAMFCQQAKTYLSDIEIRKDGKVYNAKSPIMVMAACIDMGDEIELHATGSDQNEAETSLAEYLSNLVD